MQFIIKHLIELVECYFFFQAEDGIRDYKVTGVQTCAVAIGSLVYFVVTLLVEGAYAFRWQRRKQLGLARTQIWRGVLLANAATYVVLAPLHYYATRPGCEIREFSKDTRWTSQPTVKVIFTDATNHYLKCARLDGSA